MNLISTQEALKTILEHSQNYGVEKIPFSEASGRVLKEEVYADRDFPPFNRVAMDGVAVQTSQFESGRRTFVIEGVQPAGSPQLSLLNEEHCIEVMTGAVLPENVDTVIPYELTTISNGIATLNIEELTHFQNIHPKGKDQHKDAVILRENTVLSPAEIGVLTTVGISEVTVAKVPKVMIVSTGDELVDVHETPSEYQIRRSNVYTLQAMLKEQHIHADTAHIADDKQALKKAISRMLDSYDVLLFSGAVSKGKFDFIPEILDELGVEKLFHKVAQRPGKPFWFGQKVGEENSKVVFAFPGNPVSTFVSCLKYFMPWYRKSLGLSFKSKFAVLNETISFKKPLTYFLQVQIKNEAGVLKAHPVQGNGSGDLANLVLSDAFMQLPADKTEFKKGEVYPIIPFRNF